MVHRSHGYGLRYHCSPFRAERVCETDRSSFVVDIQHAGCGRMNANRAIGPIEMSDSFRLSRLAPVLTIGPGHLDLPLRKGSGRNGIEARITT